MTDTMFTHTALTEAAENAGITADQARTILEAAGVKVQPEKPAPGLYLHEDGRPIIMIGPNFTEPDSYLTVVDESHWTRGNRDKLTPARIVPVTELEAVRAAQDTLEELAKMGVAESDRGSVLEMAARLAVHGIDSDEVDRMVKHHYSTAAATPVTLTEDQALALRAEVDPANRSVPALPRELVTKFANAVLAQHAAPAEDMPDWDDVRNAVASQRGNGWSLHDPAINGITDAVMRLLHREEA